MNYEEIARSHARLQYLIKLTLLCRKVNPDKKTSRHVIKKFEKLRMPIQEAQKDKFIGQLATNRLAVLEAMLNFFRTGEQSYYRLSGDIHKAGDNIAGSIVIPQREGKIDA